MVKCKCSQVCYKMGFRSQPGISSVNFPFCITVHCKIGENNRNFPAPSLDLVYTIFFFILVGPAGYELQPFQCPRGPLVTGDIVKVNIHMVLISLIKLLWLPLSAHTRACLDIGHERTHPTLGQMLSSWTTKLSHSINI